MSKTVRETLVKNYKASWSSGFGQTLQSGSIELFESEWKEMFREQLEKEKVGNRSITSAMNDYWTTPKMWKGVIAKEIEKYVKTQKRPATSLRINHKDSKFPGPSGVIEVHYFAYRKGRGRPADIEKHAVKFVKAATRLAMKKVTEKVQAVDKQLASIGSSSLTGTPSGRMKNVGRRQTSKAGAKRKTYMYSEYSHGEELPSDHVNLEYEGKNRRQKASDLRKYVQDKDNPPGVAEGAQGTKAAVNIGKALIKHADNDLLYSSGLADVMEDWIDQTFGYKLELKKGRTAQSIKDQITMEGILMPPNNAKNPDLWDTVLKQEFIKFMEEEGTFVDYVVKKMEKSKTDAEKIFSDSDGPGAWLKQNAPRVVAEQFKHLTKKGTPDMRFNVNKELFKKVKIDKKSALTDTTKKKKSKTKQIKGKKKRYPIGATRAVASRKKRPAGGVPQGQNVMALKEVLNKLLPPQVLKNMGLPRLVNRTGRFKDSAEITNIVMGPRGGMTIDYTYQRDPYEVFEPGNRLGNQYRDPKHIIGLSIREIVAMQMKGANPIIRRV